MKTTLTLSKITRTEIPLAMNIINEAKRHLKEQGIDQWQNGYPDENCIRDDAKLEKGYFIKENEEVLGYLCIDFSGEEAYKTLKGRWNSNDDYVVVHRMAFSESARGKNLSDKIFGLVEKMSTEKGINYFRIDTDEANKKMQHILKKNGFSYCGTVNFDNSEKIAFDKIF